MALVNALLAVVVVAGPSDALLSPPPTVDVIVQLWDGADTLTAPAVNALGGVVTRPLPVVVGFAATVPESAVGLIAQLPGVRAITPDALVLPQQLGVGAGATAPSVWQRSVRSDVSASQGATGAGTTVAVLDTGISPVADLEGRLVQVPNPLTGQLQGCVNFSDEPGCADTYGHGTFIAGLIAGNGASSNGRYTGVAPQANLLALKLSGRTGESHVSDVLAAIGWVVEHKDTYSIDVLNLSLRVDSPLPYRIDPMNLAVERAWARGIVVVVSAGNLGPEAGTIAKPADDPWVITVGSTNDEGTVAVGDDTIADFSSRGPTRDGVVKPDVVVPGRSLVSLRSPGSEADLRYPYFVNATYRRGSGTSFSTGIVSGAAAALLSADPTLTPDAVKHALMATARPLAGVDGNVAGAGTVDIAGALAAPDGLANQQLFHPLFSPYSPGSLADFAGSLLTGPLAADPQGSNWQGSNWQGSNWQGSNWQGSNWQGSNWQGSNWQGSNWQGSNWQSQYWN